MINMFVKFYYLKANLTNLLLTIIEYRIEAKNEPDSIVQMDKS